MTKDQFSKKVNMLAGFIKNIVTIEMPVGKSDKTNSIYKHLKSLRDLAIDGYSASCLLYTYPSPRDRTRSRMPSSA